MEELNKLLNTCEDVRKNTFLGCGECEYSKWCHANLEFRPTAYDKKRLSKIIKEIKKQEEAKNKYEKRLELTSTIERRN